MNSQILLETLTAQDINLELLIENLENQKKAITKNDYALLEKEIAVEQKILSSMDREEMNRNNIIKEASRILSVSLEKNSIDEFLLKCKSKLGKDYREIENIRYSIKDKLQIVLNLNTQLKDVINFSRNMIKETMMIFAGPQNNAIVNKRV